jgi:hypothetical protein
MGGGCLHHSLGGNPWLCLSPIALIQRVLNKIQDDDCIIILSTMVAPSALVHRDLGSPDLLLQRWLLPGGIILQGVLLLQGSMSVLSATTVRCQLGLLA